ncbi:MAG: pectin acetylesterase-family hydrolase [Kofleriaceae bacterium]
MPTPSAGPPTTAPRGAVAIASAAALVVTLIAGNGCVDDEEVAPAGEAPRVSSGPAGTHALAPSPVRRFALHHLSDPDAVCNDGSPGAYFLRPGTPGNDRWIIHLSGGDMCASPAACATRWAQAPQLMSSTLLPTTIHPGGIFSLDHGKNPVFAEDNHVVVHYCSSDLYAGTGEDAGAGWRFHGRAIVDAVIADLPLASAERVVVSGHSAGSYGVYAHADAVAAALPGVEVLAMTDAGGAVLHPPMNPALPTILALASAGLAYWSGQVDASCAAAWPAEPARCLFVDGVLAHLDTPTLVTMAQDDVPYLSYLGVTPPLDPQEQAFAAGVGAQIAAALASADGAFVPAHGPHGVLGSDAAWTLSIGGVTPYQVVQAFVAGTPILAIE